MGKDGVQASHRRPRADGERGGVVGETGAGAQEGRELVRAISDRVSVRGWREGLAVAGGAAVGSSTEVSELQTRGVV